MTLAELQEKVAVLREFGDRKTEQEKRWVAAAEAGTVSHESSDSARFDIWASVAESFYDLLGAVEGYLKGLETDDASNHQG